MLTMKMSYICHVRSNGNVFHVIGACKGTSLVRKGLKILHQGLKFSQKVWKSLPGNPRKLSITTPENERSNTCSIFFAELSGGYFHIRRWGGGGGLDMTSSLEAKFGQGPAKFIKQEENLGSSVTTRRKSWEKITILGAFGLYLNFKG